MWPALFEITRIATTSCTRKRGSGRHCVQIELQQMRHYRLTLMPVVGTLVAAQVGRNVDHCSALCLLFVGSDHARQGLPSHTRQCHFVVQTAVMW